MIAGYGLFPSLFNLSHVIKGEIELDEINPSNNLSFFFFSLMIR